MGARLAVCLSASRVSIDSGSVHGSADLELCGLALPGFDPQRAAHGFWPATPGVAAGIVQWRETLAGPQEVAELVATVPGGLERYRPCLRYFLLDEGRFTEDDLAPLRNLAAAPFWLENSRTPADVQRVLRALIDWLKAPD